MEPEAKGEVMNLVSSLTLLEILKKDHLATLQKNAALESELSAMKEKWRKEPVMVSDKMRSALQITVGALRELRYYRSFDCKCGEQISMQKVRDKAMLALAKVKELLDE